ncbi:OML2 [Hepatospora eriocheir]|uniref:OML2 n=1 Tax=Hepatospora eriocheir TaxID=1081669 RepID=A0A1X0QBS9_9MICR|nr:OML2 [Hepatospora eriocheir]
MNNLPTRTLLITGLDNENQVEKFISMQSQDSILETYRVPKTCLLFITFFDIRNSIDLLKNLNLLKDQFPNLNIFYTISKNELPSNEDECKEKNNQASVIVQYKNFNLSSDKIYDLASTCGEIRECRMDKVGQKIYEYFNIKAAKIALNELNLADFEGGNVKTKPVWDIMPNQKATILNRTDQIIKEELDKKQINLNESIKRIKTSKSKNIFIDQFDEFIINNLSQIERLIFKNKKSK